MYMFQLEPSDIQPDAQQFSGTMNTPCIESNDADPRKLSEKTGGDNCPTGGATSGMMCKVEPLGSDTDRNCRSVTVSNTVQKYEICYNMMEADFEKQIDEQNSNDFASTATNVQQEAYSEKQIDELDSDGLVSDGTDDKQDSGVKGKLAVNISGVTKLSDVSNNMGISAAGAISPLLYEQQDASAVGVSSGVLKPTIDLQPQFANTPFFSPDDLSHLLAKSDVGQAIIQNSLKGPLSKDSKKELAGIIANHHLSCHSAGNNVALCRLPKAVLENYVNCVKLRFPAENNDMLMYYIPATPPERKNPGGSIYQAYKRLKSVKRDRERRELQHTAKLVAKENNANPHEAEQSEANRWLALNNAPWDTVMKMWKMTETCRFEDTKTLKPVEIIAKYRHYAAPLGYQLVSKGPTNTNGDGEGYKPPSESHHPEKVLRTVMKGWRKMGGH
ncbi:uncharacterized protein LOC134205933 [Armigeres subalbatus]|uniref:uncharacterized protein LOC134205933 n=1 Tax=Armigeres subalbatus TaxID=124917 RepID=UPI002ED51DB9